MASLRWRLFGFFLIFLLGCAPRHNAVVVERDVLTQRQQDEKIGGQFIRIAQPGDTLYSIAFVTGLDVNKIAAWNGIQDTSKLMAGQRIRLTKPIGFKPARPRVKKDSASKKKLVKKPKVVVKKDKPIETRTQKKQLVRQQKANTKSTNSTTTKRNTKKITAKRVSWQWPLRGTLTNRFSPNKGQKGINIQGSRGQAIKASAGGEVVYAGNSLKGYGHLIIVKHSEVYWSAYANNEKILVEEGDVVAQGQALAKLGLVSGGKAISQFQIRKNGNPVDPMLYLE